MDSQSRLRVTKFCFTILQRIGSEVVHPATLVGKLFQRHCEIPHERNMQIAQYHAQALGSALKVRDLSDQEAKKSLSSRGFGLYERSKKYSRNLTYDENCNGSITLLRRDGTEYLTLSNNATYCYCKDWIAYVGIECAHLYVARNKKFDIGLWKPHFPIQKRLDVASPHWDKTSQRHLVMYHLWRVMALNVFLREKTMNQTGPKVIVLCTKSMATFRRS